MMMMMMMMVIIIIIARDISGESINFQRIYPSFQYTDFDDMHVISNAPVVRLPCVLCRDDRRNASGCLNHYGRRTSIANRKRFVWKGSGRGGGRSEHYAFSTRWRSNSPTVGEIHNTRILEGSGAVCVF